MTTGDILEAIKAIAAVCAMLGGMGGVGLWAMRAIIRAELRPTAEGLIRVESAVEDCARRIDHAETRIDALSRVG